MDTKYWHTLYYFNNFILHKSLQLVIALDAFGQSVHPGPYELLHVRVTCSNLQHRDQSDLDYYVCNEAGSNH